MLVIFGKRGTEVKGYSSSETVSDLIIEYSEDSLLLPQERDYLDIDRKYRELVFFYEAAISQLKGRIDILAKEFQFQNERNPIENVKSRIKTKESILIKMEKKGLPMTGKALVKNVFDVAGIRIICPFVSDVYHVAKMILRQRDVDLLIIKDYIRDPKENGYRSLHIIVQVEVPFSEEVKKIPVEIQIRTIAMNFWASTEHQLRYKKNRTFTEEMQKKLKHCADLMAEADAEMQQVAEDFYSEQW